MHRAFFAAALGVAAFACEQPPLAELYSPCAVDEDCRGIEARCEPGPGDTPDDAFCTKTCDIFAGQDSADGHNFDSPLFCDAGVCFVDEEDPACSDADDTTPCQVSGRCIPTAARE